MRRPLAAAAVVATATLAFSAPAHASTTIRATVHPATAALASETQPSTQIVHLHTYRVRAGDTLSALSQRFGVPLDKLVAFNKIPDPNFILAGQILTLNGPNHRRAATRAHPAVVDKVVEKSAPVVHSTPAPPPQPVATASGAFTGVWACIAQHESGGNPAENTGNGFYGGLQFTEQSWLGEGGGAYAPYANEATAAEQEIVAQKLLAAQGWGAWPVTSVECGL